jgi:membrane-bound metal-dependent hydrolase YbcI (DUF457 family)
VRDRRLLLTLTSRLRARRAGALAVAPVLAVGAAAVATLPAGMNGKGSSFQSVNFPIRFIRHFNFTVSIASDGGPDNFDSATSWTDDVSWLATQPWAP